MLFFNNKENVLCSPFDAKTRDKILEFHDSWTIAANSSTVQHDYRLLSMSKYLKETIFSLIMKGK